MRIILTIALYYLSLHSFAQIYKGSSSIEEQSPVKGVNAVLLTGTNDVDISIGFDFISYGKSYNSVHWKNVGKLYFSNGFFTTPLDTVSLISVCAPLGFGDETPPLEGELEIYYELVSLNNQKVCRLTFEGLEFRVPDGDDLEVDRVYFSVLVELWENGDVIINYYDVSQDDYWSLYSPVYFTGYGQQLFDINGVLATNKYSLAARNLKNTNGFWFTDDFNNSNGGWSWSVIVDGAKIKFSPNGNFTFSNLTHERNVAVINVDQPTGLKSYFVSVFPQGMNKYQDKGMVTKYVFDYPVEIKGLTSHNGGEYLQENDSVEFIIKNINIDGTPGELIYSKKHNVNCLLLDGSANLIAFDSTVVITDSCFIGFLLPEYSYTEKNKGIHFKYNSQSSAIDYDDQITFIKMINDQWLSTVAGRTNSERFGVTLDGSDDLIVPAIFPVVSNIGKGDDLEVNTFCSPIGLFEMKEKRSSISLYPTLLPKGSVLTINSDHKIVFIQVIDQVGKVVKEYGQGHDRDIISFSELNAGLYLIKVVNNLGEVQAQRIQYDY